MADHRRLRRHPGYVGPERTRVMLGLLDVYLADGHATLRGVAAQVGRSLGTINRQQMPDLVELGLVAWTPGQQGTLRPTVVPMSASDAERLALAEATIATVPDFATPTYSMQPLHGPRGQLVAHLERWPQEGRARFTRLRADGQPCARSAVFAGQPAQPDAARPGD